MKHNNSPVGAGTDYNQTVNAAMGITESRNEELHKRLQEEVDGMRNSGEHLSPAGLMNRIKNITTEVNEVAMLAYTIAETFNALNNPMAHLAAMLQGKMEGKMEGIEQ